MATILYKNADKTVSSITERNNLPIKIDNMVVTVLDAIADPNAGAGVATFRWNDTTSSWILISKSATDTMNFETEELVITQGRVSPKNIAIDNVVWGIKILEGNIVIAEPTLDSIIVTPTLISGLGLWEGKSLRFTYAYGTIGQQVETYVDERLDGFVSAGTILDFEGGL